MTEYDREGGWWLRLCQEKRRRLVSSRVTNNSQPDGVVGIVCQSSASPTPLVLRTFPKENLRSAPWDHVSKTTNSNKSSNNQNTRIIRKSLKESRSTILHQSFIQWFRFRTYIWEKLLLLLIYFVEKVVGPEARWMENDQQVPRSLGFFDAGLSCIERGLGFVRFSSKQLSPSLLRKRTWITVDQSWR